MAMSAAEDATAAEGAEARGLLEGSAKARKLYNAGDYKGALEACEAAQVRGLSSSWGPFDVRRVPRSTTRRARYL